MLRFLIGIQTIQFHSFRSTRSRGTIRKCFFKKEYPGILPVTLTEFSQLPEAILPIIVTVEKSKNDVPFAS